MAKDIEKLVLSIEANTRQLERSMKKVEKSVGDSMQKSSTYTKKFNTSLAASQRHMATFLKTMAGAVAVGSFAQLPGVVADLVSQTADIGKVADKVGLTTQSLQELRFAAELTGLSAGQLDTGMQRFARRLAEAANGSGELLAILKANNVALRNADGSMRSQNELLDDYADLIKNAGSEQEQLLLAFKGFDTEGAAMVNVLRDGSQGLREFRQEAHDAGGVIEDDLIREMEALDDRFQRLSRTISITLKSAVLDTVSVISDMMEGLKGYEEQTTQRLEKQLAGLRELQSNNRGNWLGDEAGQEADLIEKELAARIEQARELKSTLSDVPGASPEIKGLAPTRATVIPASGGGGDQDAKIQRVIDGLKRQAAALTETTEAQRLNNALTQAGVTLKSAAGQEIEMLVQRETALREALEAAAVEQLKLNEAMSLAETSGMAMFDSLMDGARDFDETIQDIAKNIMRMAVQSSLFGTGGLANLMGTSKESGGSGGLLGGLIGSLFDTVPRYHNGGIAGLKPDEVPAVLQRGERIIPAGVPSAPSVSMGGGDNNVEVNVINNSGGEVTRSERNEGGVNVVDIVVGKVKEDIARGGMDGVMGSRYGARPRVLRR